MQLGGAKSQDRLLLSMHTKVELPGDWEHDMPMGQHVPAIGLLLPQTSPCCTVFWHDGRLYWIPAVVAAQQRRIHQPWGCLQSRRALKWVCRCQPQVRRMRTSKSSQGNAESCGTKIRIDLAQYRSNSNEHRRHPHLRRSKKSAACRPSRRLPQRAFAPKGSHVELHVGLPFLGAMAFRSSGRYVCSSLSKRKPCAIGEPELALLFRESNVQATGPKLGTNAGGAPSLTCEPARDVVQNFDTATGLRMEHRYSFPFRKKL